MKKESNMPKFFVTNQNIENKQITIIGNDVNHIKKVLRKKQGECITICNKDTYKDYLCEILKLGEKEITCRIVQELESDAESNVQISIWQGLPKADKMELIIQKAVELGCYDITPIEMKRCVVKLNDKDKKKKQERWQKIAEVAAKQSGRNRVPVIHNTISIKDICKLYQEYDRVIVAYEKEKENKLRYELEKIKLANNRNWKIAILIGPEGGIDETEIEELKKENVKIVTLGNRILRTETVAFSLLSIIMYELEK